MVQIRDTASQDRAVDNKAGNRRRMILLIGGGVLLAVTAAFAIPAVTRWSSIDQSFSAERLSYGTVERGRFVRDITANGRVVAAVRPTLYSPADGTVTFTVQEGDNVDQDQVLATIDSPELSNQLKQEDATLDSLEIAVERERISMRQEQLENQRQIDTAYVTLLAAEREMRRAEDAHKVNAISAIDYEKAKDDLETARLNHKHAVEDAKLQSDALAFEVRTREKDYERHKLLVDDLERQVQGLAIASPVDGMVGNLIVDQKTAVARNQALVMVVDLTAFEVEVQVPESYADSLGLGMGAEISYGNQTYDGVLSAISPEVQNSQVIGRVRFEGDVPEGLRQNQRVSTRIVLDERDDVLLVRRGRFYDTGAGRIAYLVNDGVAERREIQTGASGVGEIEIINGLNEGDTIVLSDIGQFDGAERVLLND